MNAFYELFPSQLVRAIGWTLLHSLWQGLAIALMLALLLVCMHRSSASIRYFVATGAMLTFATMALITFVNEYSYAPTPLNNFPIVSNVSLDKARISKEVVITEASASAVENWSLQMMTDTFLSYFLKHIPLIVLLWSIGIILLIIRFIGGFAYTQRLKNYKTVELPANWQLTLHSLAKAAGITRSVKLVESALVKVPMVVGYIKPVILLPVGTIIGLPAEQVEAILAHELAHIYRKDYLVNIFQCMIEIIFFYHPAVWWISSRIREEREHCCDDIALNLCGNGLTFAKALANLQNVNNATPALAFGFMGKGNRLLSRIKRLAHSPKQKPNFMEGFLAACFVMFSITAISVSAGVQKKPEKTVVSENNPSEKSLLQRDSSKLQSFSDTTKNTFSFQGTRNGKRYDIKAIMQKGTIIALVVNGKKIPDAEKGEYYDLIHGLMESVPAPPSPALAPAIPGRIDPGFPVDPVIAPHPEPVTVAPAYTEFWNEATEVVEPPMPPQPSVATVFAQKPQDMHAVLAPADAVPVTEIDPLAPHPPVPAVAPMTPEIISNIIRAAFNRDTTYMKKGDFVYHFTGKNEKTYRITIKDGVLTELKVDGKRIDNKDLAKYLYIAEEVEEDARLRQNESRAMHETALTHQRKLAELQNRQQRKQNALEHEMQMLDKEQEEASKNHEQAMQEHERAMARHDESAKLSKELTRLMNTELLKDKLILKNGKHYIRIGPEGLFIDGVMQPDSIFEKYKKLIEKKAGKPLEFTIQYPLN